MGRHRCAFALLSLVGALSAAAAGAQSGAQSPAPAPVDSTTVGAARSDSTTTKPPPAPAPLLPSEIRANAFVSFGYTYNVNRPTDRLNGYRVFDADANTFDVDVAELVLQRPVTKPGETGVRVDLEVGGAIPEKTQASGLSVGRSADLQQAFLSYIAPIGSGLRLDFGKFVTHLGYEVIEGYDGYNDNYSRSFLFNYAIPFTHTGVKATYAVSSALSATLMVVNGWDDVKDNNSGKSLGAQLLLAPAPPFTLALNYVGGPEKPDTNGFVRNTFDVVATWKALERLTLGLNGDYGVESGASLASPGTAAVWKGVAGYARYDVTSAIALALRAETFRDEGGTRLGAGPGASLGEVTVTPTYKVSDRFIVRGDVRFDSANRAVFVREGGALRARQTTVAGNVVFVY